MAKSLKLCVYVAFIVVAAMLIISTGMAEETDHDNKMNQPPPPSCDKGTCISSCQAGGYNEGDCFDGSCFCSGKVPPCNRRTCDRSCNARGYKVGGFCSRYLGCLCLGKSTTPPRGRKPPKGRKGKPPN